MLGAACSQNLENGATKKHNKNTLFPRREGAKIPAQLPTGHGNSLMAIVPAVACGRLTIFVAPTLALIDDLLGKFTRRQILVFRLIGASTCDEQRLTAEEILRGFPPKPMVVRGVNVQGVKFDGTRDVLHGHDVPPIRRPRREGGHHARCFTKPVASGQIDGTVSRTTPTTSSA